MKVKDGELHYYERIGEQGQLHALLKPFSDHECGPMLMEVGAMMSLLPPPPARILECGCGAGWLAAMLQRRGYVVTAIDAAPKAIELARTQAMRGDIPPVSFEVGTYESIRFDAEFDAVVFFDSLHHAVDEQAAINNVYRALKPGGICVASETGPGHEAHSQDVVAAFDVTEKDMPPSRIAELARGAGFSHVDIRPRGDELGRLLFARTETLTGWRRWLPKSWLLRAIAVQRALMKRRSYGIAVLTK